MRKRGVGIVCGQRAVVRIILIKYETAPPCSRKWLTCGLTHRRPRLPTRPRPSPFLLWDKVSEPAAGRGAGTDRSDVPDSRARSGRCCHSRDNCRLSDTGRFCSACSYAPCVPPCCRRNIWRTADRQLRPGRIWGSPPVCARSSRTCSRCPRLQPPYWGRLLPDDHFAALVTGLPAPLAAHVAVPRHVSSLPALEA